MQELLTANGNDIFDSNSGNTGIGISTPLSKLDVNGHLALNDNELRLRAGNNNLHGLKYDATVDGPYLFGYNGGALGTSGLPNSLEWSFTGDVSAKNNFYTQHSIVVDNASSNTGSLTNGLTFLAEEAVKELLLTVAEALINMVWIFIPVEIKVCQLPTAEMWE
ncbi:MAG: hypothetical protein IPP27_14510 [Bacteroidetes bacterium]|nr:hypothetical protein [Bacteroidota bacterium]